MGLTLPKISCSLVVRILKTEPYLGFEDMQLDKQVGISEELILQL